MAERSGLLGLRRGFAVLRLLAGTREGLAFSRLAAMTGLPAPTLSRILRVLNDEGLARKDGKYSLGPEFVNLARIATGTASREELLQPVLEALGRDTGESAAYYELRGLQVSCLAKAEQPDSFHYMPVGGHNPRILKNGFGQLCVAFLETGEQENILPQVESGPAIPIREFAERLTRIRQEKIFAEHAEASESVIRIVAPVFAGDAFAGSMGITLLRRRLKKAALDGLKQKVKQAAEEASHILAR